MKKLGLPEGETAIHQITYNVSGSNARVNVNFVDNSTHSVGSSDVEEQLKAIREAIQKLKLVESERANALEVLDAVEVEIAKANPKRAVISALLDSLPKVATIASTIAKIGVLIADGVERLS